ncbi:MAG: hypothetical protein IPM57_06880 [Oligoflexia bacterium]|nr:hypothetical protein [Oligoflexia bacterium]
MTKSDALNQKLKSTLTDLKLALDEWDSIKAEEAAIKKNPELDLRKKTQDLVKQLNEQIKELGL